MSVGVQHPGLFRFSCAGAAAILLVIPVIHIVGGLLANGDHALQDTYYVTAGAQTLALMTALVVCHFTVAAACAILAVGESGGYIAGWMFALSAGLMAISQAGPSLVMVLSPMPQRYVDYEGAWQAASWIYDVAHYAGMVAAAGMAAGWLVLAATARRKQA
jgi:hypothetical protein